MGNAKLGHDRRFRRIHRVANVLPGAVPAVDVDTRVGVGLQLGDPVGDVGLAGGVGDAELGRGRLVRRAAVGR